MANRSQSRGRPEGPASGVPTTPEPPVRRWPHPVSGTEAADTAETVDPALHFIGCALSYQNQLLADIKALLETLAAAEAPPAEEEPD